MSTVKCKPEKVKISMEIIKKINQIAIHKLDPDKKAVIHTPIQSECVGCYANMIKYTSQLDVIYPGISASNIIFITEEMSDYELIKTLPLMAIHPEEFKKKYQIIMSNRLIDDLMLLMSQKIKTASLYYYKPDSGFYKVELIKSLNI